MARLELHPQGGSDVPGLVRLSGFHKDLPGGEQDLRALVDGQAPGRSGGGEVFSSLDETRLGQHEALVGRPESHVVLEVGRNARL